MSFPRAMLDRLRIAVGRWRRDHLHAHVEAPEGAARFGLFGGDARVRAQFARWYLEDGDGRAQVHRRWHGSDWSAAARALARRDGLVVVAETRPPAALEPELVRLPRLVGLSVDPGDEEDAFVRGLSFSARDDVRRVRKSGLACEIADDPAWCAEFFARYHAPSMQARHAAEAKLITVPQMQAMLHAGGEFVRVLAEGRCVAAMIGSRRGEAYAMEMMGWLDADPAHIRAGAQSALYWFSFQRARALGLRQVDLGGALPRLEDGVLRYKAKWNPRLVPFSEPHEAALLLLDPAHAHVRRWLARQTLVAGTADGRFFALGARGADEVRTAPALAASLAAWFCLRETPDTAPAALAAATELPPALRPWFARHSGSGIREA